MPPRNPICPECGGEKAYRKRYCVDCLAESRRQSAKRYRKTAKGKATVRRLLLVGRYNLTLEQYQELWDKQEGKCAICPDFLENPNIDHDHSCCPGIESCGKCIRGLLCNRCNQGLGFFRDSTKNLRKAIEYLEDL